MKYFKHMLVAASIALVSMPAAAQFSIGPHVGVNVNGLRFNRTIANKENRAGFTGGVKLEFMIPKTSVGFDASVLYVHRNKGYENSNSEYVRESKDYVEIPVHLKWKIGIPAIGKLITPYVFTGPSFSFLTGTKEIHDTQSYKSMDLVWNVGFGVQLLKHFQIGASYGFGLNDSYNRGSAYAQVKDRCWSVTTAWLF